MTERNTLADWLRWQESINSAEISLGLERMHAVMARLDVPPPPQYVFTVAGTNGKGSCVATLDALLCAAGERVGRYTSPHLVRYNERIAVAGRSVDDAVIVAAFEAIEAVRGDIPLTFFEYGTLAALQVFAAESCTAWVLEVGLGGRLDAVNSIDPACSIITTVDLDHQAWLGDTIEAIAGEKAGILRAGVPAFYGDYQPPEAVLCRAAELGAPLAWPDHGYSWWPVSDGASWSWKGRSLQLAELPWPADLSAAQICNRAVALAALESLNPGWLGDAARVHAALAELQVPGRFQRFDDGHEWVLDVAHNPQAARSLHEQLARLPAADTTVVAGLLADKQACGFIAALDIAAARWVLCPTAGARGLPASELADLAAAMFRQPPAVMESVPAALAHARAVTPPGGRILVCGSFQVVGPALEWLGLY